ncbi:MAG TPA: hypothetical protein VIF62_21570 [Labilithrix sp.]
MTSRRPGAIAAIAIAMGCSSHGTGGDAPGAVSANETPAPAVDVLVHRYDLGHSGVQSKETILGPQTVASTAFGLRATFPVDGSVYAQPLVVSNVTLGGQLRDILLVATQHDSIYAFDASGKEPAPLWQTTLLGDGETTVPTTDVGTGNIVPEIGVTGTPVVDRSRNVMYVVAKSKRPDPNDDDAYVQRLHMLDLQTGLDVVPPVEISGAVTGTAPDAENGRVAFEPLRANQRAALVLGGGRVWIAWASHGDIDPYHGWIFAYDATDITKPPLVWATTPDGAAGGVWHAGGGVSIDDAGDVFLASGNGTFDAQTGGRNFGEAAVRLRVSGDAITVVDWFSPHDNDALSAVDSDFGTISPILVDRGGKKLAITGSKEGSIYVLNRDDLGGYQADTDRIVQRAALGVKPLLANPAFFDGMLYVGVAGTGVFAYAMQDDGTFDVAPRSMSKTCLMCWSYGGSPVVSANGTDGAVVWALDVTGWKTNKPAVLHAWDARDLSHQLYQSDLVAKNDAPLAVKFTTPTVSGGRVYVGGVNGVALYGVSR